MRDGFLEQEHLVLLAWHHHRLHLPAGDDVPAAILLVVLASNLIGDGLGEVLNPRLRRG